MSFMIMTHTVKTRPQGPALAEAETGEAVDVYRRPYTTLQLALRQLFPGFGKD
ncbi:hypothetical protein LRX75_11440 [Rhizobium sp. DKSPLA3]|uniref:Uncharacterized protein n=1 Tax=Rhizobium quercicola TaxID=2901226 RepID=A0A9X1NSK8_9HYPH|nr:hypothetical protein [Rhizobium quercicola]MCD7109658.1 hypothetical protein [Rhizobium quercicola]